VLSQWIAKRRWGSAVASADAVDRPLDAPNPVFIRNAAPPAPDVDSGAKKLGRPVGGVFVRRGSVRGVKALVPSPVLSPGRRGFSQARGAHPFLLCPIGRVEQYRRGIVYVSAGPVRNSSSCVYALCYHQPRGVECPLRTP
jgi:hypothetical protein